MTELVHWLAGLEREAADLYSELADFFLNEPRLTRFYQRLAEDEEAHCRIMAHARAVLEASSSPVTAQVHADPETRQAVEKPLRECRALMEAGTLGPRTAMEALVRIEFRELNSAFLYVVDALKQDGRESQRAVADIQAHERRIREFITGLPDEWRPADLPQELPRVWTTRFLVVDDDTSLLVCLKLLFGRMGVVDTARNGRDALTRAAERHYDMIVADINMPVMDGVTFFRETSKSDPDLARRFVFLSGDPSSDHLALCEEHGVAYFAKPVSLAALRKTAERILHSV